jgi:hypothetical protein
LKNLLPAVFQQIICSYINCNLLFRCNLKVHKRENFFGSDFELYTFYSYVSLNIKVL